MNIINNFDTEKTIIIVIGDWFGLVVELFIPEIGAGDFGLQLWKHTLIELWFWQAAE